MAGVVIDDTRISYAKHDLAKGVTELAQAETYGLKNCKRTWGSMLAQDLIIEVLECTERCTLNQSEVDCLQGKMSENLGINCC